MDNKLDAVSQIRSFNRFYTNVLGLLDQHILESGYSLTEVRILLEISKVHQCTANSLANRLEIDRSYMSRIIKHLEKDELIAKVQSEQDNRMNFIALTEKGKYTLDILSKKSDEKIANFIQHFNSNEVSKVLDAMQIMKDRISEIINPITIRSFTEDDIDYVICRHQILYREEYGLSNIFGDYVEESVHHFAQNYDKYKECMLIPEMNGHPVGSIAIVKVDDETAQLRYFFLESETRSRGLGNKLVDMALDFSKEKGYKHIFLETISILNTARHIYASKGFKITQTHKNTTWGNNILEERWDMDL